MKENNIRVISAPINPIAQVVLKDIQELFMKKLPIPAKYVTTKLLKLLP